MAKRRAKPQPKKGSFDDLSPHTKQAIGAVFFVVLGILFTLSLFGYAGMIGSWTKVALDFLFGGGSYLAPFICAFYVYAMLNPKEDEQVSTSKIIGIALLFISILSFMALYSKGLGGIVGALFEFPLAYLTGELASGFIIGAVFLIGLFLTFNTGLRFPKRAQKEEIDETDFEALVLRGDDDDSPVEIISEEPIPIDDIDGKDEPARRSVTQRLGLSKSSDDFVVSSFSGPYAPPPLSLLQKDKAKGSGGDVKANANIIKRTLQKFNIEVEMDEVTIGPSVTRYALKPAEGVRLEKIVGLQTNLEYALAAHPIRIEAPIPGKSLVGIEVPNAQKQTVGLASVFASPEYTDSPKPLLIAIGKDITGKAHFANVARMPHGLIAGTTGSGKSVMIHNLIISLLFRNSPEQLRFILVDPKRVELTLYNGIPHLLSPVITEPKKVILALKWAIKEMERRLDVLQSFKVQNIASYHETVYQPAKTVAKKDADKREKSGESEPLDAEPLPEPLPYIVIVVDELADLMQAYPKELEACIVRLAQMSRAVGIHLILTTQRPSVNVITGTIKANVPTRMAFQVASQIDSRTILDMAGAEKLLGQGDMLFLSAEQSKPTRLQSAFVSTDEVNKVVAYLKQQSDAQELDSINLDGDSKDGNADAFFGASVDDETDDDLYEDAKQAVIEAGKASTSYIQRKLRVGYSRAARLMDLLEERGVIGSADGARPREILIGKDGIDGYEQDDTADEHRPFM
jgi:DNA segregation ATPase FtsK/SpoIIIE, S-DNA-T family